LRFGEKVISILSKGGVQMGQERKQKGSWKLREAFSNSGNRSGHPYK
jgi:hypothetical protein